MGTNILPYSLRASSISPDAAAPPVTGALLVGVIVVNEEGLRDLKNTQSDVLERLGTLLDKLDSSPHVP